MCHFTVPKPSLTQHHLLGEVKKKKKDLMKELKNPNWKVSKNARRLPQQQGWCPRNRLMGSPAAGTATTGHQMGCCSHPCHHQSEFFLLSSDLAHMVLWAGESKTRLLGFNNRIRVPSPFQTPTGEHLKHRKGAQLLGSFKKSQIQYLIKL